MNSTATTTGGYAGSEMHSWLTGTATTIIKNAFGENHLLAHRLLLTKGTYDSNSITHGFYSEWSSPTYLVLPSEAQLGYRGWSDLGWSTGEAYKTLSIFKYESIMNVLGRDFGQSNNNFNSHHAWLRDISSNNPGTNFCRADYGGSAYNYSASSVIGHFPLAIFK